MRRSRMHCPVRPQTYPVRIRTRPAGRAPQRRKHRNRAASPPASRTPRLCQKHPQARPAQRKTNKPPAGRTVRTAVPRTAKLRPFPIKQPQPLVLLPKQLHGRNQKSRCLRKACRLLKQRKTAVPPPRFPLTGGVKSIEPPTTKHKTQKRSRISCQDMRLRLVHPVSEFCFPQGPYATPAFARRPASRRPRTHASTPLHTSGTMNGSTHQPSAETRSAPVTAMNHAVPNP